MYWDREPEDLSAEAAAECSQSDEAQTEQAQTGRLRYVDAHLERLPGAVGAVTVGQNTCPVGFELPRHSDPAGIHGPCPIDRRRAEKRERVVFQADPVA